MAKDGRRKVAALALAAGSLVGAAALADISAYAARSSGPTHAFIDADNDGVFDPGTDTPVDLGGATSRSAGIEHHLASEGFVIPSGVGSISASALKITSNSGRIEIGEKVRIATDGNIVLQGGDVVVGKKAKLEADRGGFVELDAATALVIGDKAVLKGDSLGETGPQSLVIGKGVVIDMTDDVGSLDPEREFVVGAGARIRGSNIDMGVGYGVNGSHRFVIEPGVVIEGSDQVWVGAYGSGGLTVPAGATIKSPRSMLLMAENGPLTIAGKLSATTLEIASNHSVRFEKGKARLESGTQTQTLAIHRWDNANGRVPISIYKGVIHLGNNGVANVWTDSPIDWSKVKPAEKTVLVNGNGSGPRVKTLTLNVVNAHPDSRVTIATASAPLQTCPPGPTCIQAGLKNQWLYISTTGPRAAAFSGTSCYTAGTSFRVQLWQDQNCTVTFKN